MVEKKIRKFIPDSCWKIFNMQVMKNLGLYVELNIDAAVGSDLLYCSLKSSMV
jgi:hypothetical protein